MSKSTPTAVIQLSDQQVRILAEAARMGLPEMIVRLSAISGVIKIVHMGVQAWSNRNAPPEIHFTQNINGSGVSPEKIYDETKKLLTRDKIVLPETVKGEIVDQEDDQPKGQELPKTVFEIPEQPTETPGETPGK